MSCFLSNILYLLIDREKVSPLYDAKRSFTIYVKYQMASPVLSTKKYDKSRKFEGGGGSYPFWQVSFLVLVPTKERTLRNEGRESAREAAALARTRLVKLFPPWTEKLLSNIRGSIWHQTALRMSLWGFGKCSLALEVRGKKKEKERRAERGPTVNCLVHWLLIESYGIHAGSDTLARGVKDHFTLHSELVN